MEKLKDFRATELGLIPTDWNLNLVGEVAEINPQNLRGTTDGDTEISYIDIESVNEGRISEYKKVLFRDAPSRARRIVKRNDVLISTVRPYLKAFAMIRDDVHNLVCSTGFSVVRCKEDLYPSFLYHYVFSD
ncbi:restriction endonuclease subunit S, partial [Bacillus sp. CRN 9]|nr:restriction endonuclease subunit S [Bacillus sp. CRN 9]